MQFVALLRWKSGLTREQMDGALMRRAGWEYPPTMKVVTEVWPATNDPAVVTVFDTDDFGSIMELEFTWSDVFDITVHPAIGAEDGLRVGADAMGRARSM